MISEFCGFFELLAFAGRKEFYLTQIKLYVLI